MPRAWLLLVFALPPAFSQSWTNLFDGKSLKGWTQCNGQATYRVSNGEIIGTTKEGSPNSFLCTDRNYGDFTLEFEVLTDPKLNSGVQIRSHRYDKDQEVVTENKGSRRVRHPAGRVYGYQVEIATETSRSSGGVYDEARRGWLDQAGCLALKDNQWNRYRVEANGSSIKTWVNGVACADFHDTADLDGFIALQVHSYKGDQPATVRWRNIRIEDRGRHRWRPLFDGKSMTGWKNDGGGTWTIADGALRGTQVVADKPRRGLLVSEASFGDATLRLEYRIAKGNSGVFFRTAMPLNPKEMGYEVEVDPTRDPGGLQAPGTRGWLVHGDPAKFAQIYRAGEWNELMIAAHGRRIVTRVNGLEVANVKDDPGRTEGHIALQLNPREDLEVSYRNIEILEKAR